MQPYVRILFLLFAIGCVTHDLQAVSAPVPAATFDISNVSALLLASDTIPKSYEYSRRDDRELRRLERAEERLLQYINRYDGHPTKRLRETTGGMDVAAFVLGALGPIGYVAAILAWQAPGIFIALSIVGALLGLILGAIAIGRIRRGAVGKRGLAIAGLVLGIIGVAFWLFFLVLILSFRL